jgi:hypothetical protein
MHQSHSLANTSSSLSLSTKTPGRAEGTVLRRMRMRMKTGTFSMMLERMERWVKEEVALHSIARDTH